MKKLIHKILYRLLPLENYLRVMSSLLFLWLRLGIGRHSQELEYIYHLKRLVKEGDHCIDIGANLGYYTCTLSKIVGHTGCVYAVEPMAPTRKVLSHNTRRMGNVEIYPFALGEENRDVMMANNSALEDGYMGTGRNFVKSGSESSDVEFAARMRRGSELFGCMPRLDFIKCDIEGYELIVMREMLPILERHHPTVLIETGGENRPQIIALFEALGYRGYTLDRGSEVALSSECGKDIIFRHPTNVN